MFRSGDVIANPLTGVRLVFRRTAAETGGAAVVFEAFLAPNGHVPAERVHPHQELRLEVLAGSVGTSVGGRRAVAGPGTRVVVPAGARSRVWNAGDDVAHLVAEVTPALGFEPLVGAVFGLAAAAHAGGRPGARVLERAAVAAAHFDTARAAFPPALLQRLWLALAAPLGRALGRAAISSQTLPGSDGRAS